MEPEQWKPRFLEALREEASVVHASAKAGISRRTAYNHRKSDEAFAAAWDECMESSVDDLEASAFRRAKEGWLEPVFYKGERCGEVRRFDNRLLEFMLIRWRPERYSEKAGAGAPGSGAADLLTDLDEMRRLGGGAS